MKRSDARLAGLMQLSIGLAIGCAGCGQAPPGASVANESGELERFVSELPGFLAGILETAPTADEASWRIIVPELAERRSRGLINPENLFPQADLLSKHRSLIQALIRCESSAQQTVPREEPSQEQHVLEKLSAVMAEVCRRGSVSLKVLRRPPYIHPFGGSWAQFAIQQGWVATADRESLGPYLHVAEHATLPSAFTPQEMFLGGLPPEVLRWILLRETLLFHENRFYYLAFVNFNELLYRSFTVSEMDRLFRGRTFRPSTEPGGACVKEGPGFCWVRQVDLVTRFIQFLPMAVAVLVGLLCISVGYLLVRQRRQSVEHKNAQELIFRILAHELRLPTTALTLLNESLQNQWEIIPDLVQDDLLKINEQVWRLRRLIVASENYLSSKGIVLKPIELQSLNQFIGRICANMDVTFEESPIDAGFYIDAYWFGVCVENLVKNAVLHGRRPVHVRWRLERSELLVEVEDRGEGLRIDLRQALRAGEKGTRSAGLGLGLNLVKGVLDRLGGKLSYKATPTTFVLQLKESSREKTVAG